MDKSAFFITGTDTGVGKTWASISLLQHLNEQGHSTLGLKPVAAGCKKVGSHWENEDAQLLQAYSSINKNYRQINPYAFEIATSPHIACDGVEIDVESFKKQLHDFRRHIDYVLVEGAGGWLSPLDNKLTNKTFAEQLGLPVILVVGLRLGCINQALLSVLAIQQSKLNLCGWVAMQIDEKMLYIEENIAYLQTHISPPLLTVIPFNQPLNVASLSKHWINVMDKI